MSDPGAPSGAVAEITTTSGTGSYQLSPNAPNALSAYFRFADVFMDGATITYEVDDTQSKEIVTGIFHMLANTLSRDTVLFSSNGNGLVNWPDRGQRTVRPLVPPGIPLCATPPTAGQTLIWDAVNNEWCPGTPASGGSLPLCATPATDGQDLVWDGINNEWCPDQRIIGAPGAAPGDNGKDVTLTGGLGENVDGGNGGAVNITGGAGGNAGGGNGGPINIISGAGGVAGGGNPGQITITGAASTSGVVSNITIHAGDNSAAGNAGQTLISGGTANGPNGDGGGTSISGGQAADGGTGGPAGVSGGGGGPSSGLGGTALITGGSGGSPNGTGGDVSFEAGAASGSGSGGNVTIALGDSPTGHHGVVVITKANSGSVPAVPPSGTFYIYVDRITNALTALGHSGTITTLAVP